MRPYADGGAHALPNGLLLRADIHRLYDAGYVTVTPDYRFRVSHDLADDFHNGREYERFAGRGSVSDSVRCCRSVQGDSSGVHKCVKAPRWSVCGCSVIWRESVGMRGGEQDTPG